MSKKKLSTVSGFFRPWQPQTLKWRWKTWSSGCCRTSRFRLDKQFQNICKVCKNVKSKTSSKCSRWRFWQLLFSSLLFSPNAPTRRNQLEYVVSLKIFKHFRPPPPLPERPHQPPRHPPLPHLSLHCRRHRRHRPIRHSTFTRTAVSRTRPCSPVSKDPSFRYPPGWTCHRHVMIRAGWSVSFPIFWKFKFLILQKWPWRLRREAIRRSTALTRCAPSRRRPSRRMQKTQSPETN